jgi:hypothetical protein
MEKKYATLRSPHFDEPRITRRASSQVPDLGIAGDVVILSVHHSALQCAGMYAQLAFRRPAWYSQSVATDRENRATEIQQ